MKIYVIGLGVQQHSDFSKEVVAVLNSADVIFGSPRQHDVIINQINHTRTQALPKLSMLKEQITEHKIIVILASGDPLYYGIGRWVSQQFESDQLVFYPAVSSIQSACHQLGLSLQDCEVISLHGRPLSNIKRKLLAHTNIVILTDQNSQPKHLANECFTAGLTDAIIYVCEQLGYADQKVKSFTVDELLKTDIEFDPLHVSVIKTGQQTSKLPSFPGFEDHLFITDGESGKGMMTKREVRLNILSLLSIQNQDVIWDVGAGCGSICVELAYWNNNTNIVAIEHHPERLECLQANKQKFGVNNLSIVNAKAPSGFANLPKPNKVFIGGSGGELNEILKQVWQTLPQGGLLVASAVTENTKHQLLEFMHSQKCESQTFQIAVSQSKKLAGQIMYRPNLPVTLFKLTKTEITQ